MLPLAGWALDLLSLALRFFVRRQLVFVLTHDFLHVLFIQVLVLGFETLCEVSVLVIKQIIDRAAFEKLSLEVAIYIQLLLLVKHL
jgi:hypothetical protein